MPAPPFSEPHEAEPTRSSTAGTTGGRMKRPEDTVAGCEANAASDLTRAAAMSTSNGRLRLQHSAAAWQDRADMLQRMTASFAKRRALDETELERSDAAERQPPRLDGE